MFGNTKVSTPKIQQNTALSVSMDSSNIKQALIIDGLKIIRRYPSDEDLIGYPREKLNRNVEAYSESNELIWVIEECPAGGTNQDKAYMSIAVQDGRLIVGNWVGVDFVVNLKNGCVSPLKKGVRPW